MEGLDTGAVQVALGVMISLLWAAYGYAINKVKTSPEPFDPVRFFKTLLVGFFIAMIAYTLGLPPTDPSVLAFEGLLIVLVDKLISAVMSRGGTPIGATQTKTG